MFRRLLLVLLAALAIGCQRDRISPTISKLMPNGYANALINAGNQTGYARIMQLRLGAFR